jgi:hypothetical protein
MGLNFATKRNVKASTIALITRIVTRMHGCPDERNLVYHLYSGSKFPPPGQAYPPSLQRQPIPMEPLQWTHDIDIAKVDGLVTHNSFSPISIREATSRNSSNADEGLGLDSPSAIYTLPSIFNHSCISSAVWHCFGDVIVIRARQTICKDEEVTISYTTAHDTYIARNKRL